MDKKTMMAGRIVSGSGLAVLSVLHTAWAAGSPWPAKSRAELAEVVVGQRVEMPSAASTAVVAAGVTGVSLLASGILGDGRMQRFGLRASGTGMLLRAILGGDIALAALRLPPAGDRFRRLDHRYYRPFAAVLGVSLWLAAGQGGACEFGE
ncbi:DUF3995 domain-containing protein [Arthrobacter sp. TMN-49]